ncbi:hypothetical protein FA95DRAFT_1570559 [Auriscalpium vulgare]|uniref:Uncharacterized protein n=1 Tax=Auriscalpium vulgare TaxID=40419 RepID=A0ACB8S1Y1_9AGAM|nr:hypothetical protein FA95DRAFT_1570559 [Auriscalpium vulgare]
MGKLNIAHHKSYHPYRQDNIERVRRDEEEAARKVTEDEDRALLADSESRLDALRARAGVPVEAAGKELLADASKIDSEPIAGSSSASALTPATSRGHINLFEDIEQHEKALSVRASKKAPAMSEADRGFALAPSKKDLNPWYSSRKGEKEPEMRNGWRQRDLSRKNRADPLAAIPAHVKQPPPKPARPAAVSQQAAPAPASGVEGRLARESSERERALALIRRKQREMAGSATPSTVRGGGYGDVYNKEEVEDARREREWGGRNREREADLRRRGWEDDGRGRKGRHACLGIRRIASRERNR